MSEKTKQDLLKEKLVDYFDKKLSDLTSKFTKDIETIEAYKNDYFDSVIKIYREIDEEQKKFEEQKKLEDQEKPEKKVEEPKHEKITKKKINNANRDRPKTPLATNKKLRADKENHHDTTEIHNIKDKKKLGINTGTTNIKTGKGRLATEANKRPITGRTDLKTKQAGKKTNKKDTKKATKGKKETKNNKEEVKEVKKEIKEEPKVEEKKPVIIKPKYIINTPDDIKNNNNLSTIYFVLKKNYLDKKTILYVATNNPLLYKNFGNNMKFLLDEKKNDIANKAKQIESFLNNYGDLNTYLTKEFSLTKKALNSLSMFKKKEEEEVLKNQQLPDEIGRILKCFYYLLDEKVEDNMNNKQLFENLLTNILKKSGDKTFKDLLVNYFNNNKFLNLTQEKAGNINKIINEDNNILSMTTITKICRPISLFCFLLKEIYDYINLKTSDGHYYYELRAKNAQLQKYLDFIYLYDNNGKERNPPKEEKIQEQTKNEEVQNDEKPKEENVEKVEAQKVEEITNEENPKEENGEKPEEIKKDEIKTEEIKVEEESVKKEEEQLPQN